MTDTELAPPSTEAAFTQPKLHWWREVLIALGLYLVYSLVRNEFGAGPESRSIAFRHARGVIKVEQALGLWFEPRLQQWYLRLPDRGWVRLWNIFYGTAHFFVTMGVLAAAFVWAPRSYRFLRNLLSGATVLALVGFATYTLMPPRLLDSASTFGACRYQEPNCHGYGMVDTIDRYGGIWKFGQGKMAVVSNQYAAMPSLHFAWSTWCAITLVVIIGQRRGSRRGRCRWLVFLYPAATLFCILITANHFWLDAFFGGVALVGAWGLATGIDTVQRLVAHRRAPSPSLA